MPPQPSTTRHCTFRVGDHCLAVQAEAVAEVLAARPLTRVPLAPAALLGLIHLRGRIVPILDAAARIGLPAPASRPAATHLVLRFPGDDWCGLLVDEVLDVIDIPAVAIEHPVAADEPDSPLRGVFTTPHRLIHILDHGHLVRPAARPRPPVPSTPE